MPPASARPATMHSIYESADAVWTVDEGRHTYMYAAGGFRVTDLGTAKTRTFAFVDKAKCSVARRRHYELVSCASTGRPVKVADDVFRFDPVLTSASLALEGTDVEWLGEGEPDPSATPFVTGAGVWVHGSIDRAATASGRVLGTKLHGRGRDSFAYLSEGGFAGAFTVTGASAWARSFEISFRRER